MTRALPWMVCWTRRAGTLASNMYCWTFLFKRKIYKSKPSPPERRYKWMEIDILYLALDKYKEDIIE